MYPEPSVGSFRVSTEVGNLRNQGTFVLRIRDLGTDNINVYWVRNGIPWESYRHAVNKESYGMYV